MLAKGERRVGMESWMVGRQVQVSHRAARFRRRSNPLLHAALWIAMRNGGALVPLACILCARQTAGHAGRCCARAPFVLPHQT